MQFMTKQSDVVRALLTCGAIAGPLFVVVFLVEGASRASYNPLRHPVSSLALGPFGWMQTANFIVAGLLMGAFALGLWLTLPSHKGSRAGSWLIAAWGIGLLAAGTFVTDPVSGYPPGTPDLLLNPTLHGNLHDWFSLAGFLALTASCFVFSSQFALRGERGWTIYSILTGIFFPIGIALASIAFSQNASLVAVGGLIQRITVTSGWAWLSLLAMHFLKPLQENPKGNNK